MKRLALFLVFAIAVPTFAASLGSNARTVIPSQVQQIISVDYRALKNSDTGLALKAKVMPENLKEFETAEVVWTATSSEGEVLRDLSTGELRKIVADFDSKPLANGMANGMAKPWQILAKISCRRLTRVVEKKSHIHAVRSVAGKKGAEKKWQKWQPSLSSSLNLNKRYKNHKNDSCARDSKKVSSNFREFSDYFCAAFLAKFGEKYIFQQAKDAGSIKRMLAVCELQQLEGLADKFFASPDPFIRQSGYTLGVFESQLKKL